MGRGGMDSQGSSGSRSLRSTASAQRKMLVCSHGVRPVLRVSRTIKNPERQFWGCVYYEVHGQCDFFFWADQELPKEDHEKTKLRKKVLSLKLKLKVKAYEWRLKMDTFLAILGWLGLFSMWLQKSEAKTHYHQVVRLNLG
ncbi:hypothetical protein PIB30_065119 [Stylosanthes scabra]|uniref:GRF-type domain-containing protein n=1 Tax=Stylosanthes scabra TaxID=79078 RepID=A0ABU6RLU4_9FABA|nr:hypothetical protein [Stylosanthes scabra]